MEGCTKYRDGVGLAYQQVINKGAEIIKNGGVVAFPTETVYGLGACLWDPQAISRVYEIKGRPKDNPLIAHICNIYDMEKLLSPLNGYALKLIENFWPGPLTIVAEKKTGVPPWIGGHPSQKYETIAIRMPSHPIARALIECSKCPIAAPSANISGTPSPTNAAHVEDDFKYGIDYIIDGGQAKGGLESTVVDVTGSFPIILRPGAVTMGAVEAVCGCTNKNVLETNLFPRSPGTKYRHYAPDAEMILVKGVPNKTADYIISKTINETGPVGILTINQNEKKYHQSLKDRIIIDPCNDNAYGKSDIYLLSAGDATNMTAIGQNLYSCLRLFNKMKVKKIYAESTSEDGIGDAIMDRLVKASGGNIINVE